MPKLNHLQRSLLATAAARPGGNIHPLASDSLAAPSLNRSICALLADCLIEERETAEPDYVAHKFGDLRFGYFVTPAGRGMIGQRYCGSVTSPTSL